MSGWPPDLPRFPLTDPAVERDPAVIFPDLRPIWRDQVTHDIRKKEVKHKLRAKTGQIEDATQTAEYHDALKQAAIQTRPAATPSS